ncbi:hypothetical protein EV127DRAFT_90805 [Xylaria flabelliformis]|nr:hypothetical protein EV127DRAFT_90805 [Xylaria flabelliformis]
MDIIDQEPSCLNVDPHDDNITDPVLHYFGCLEASERASFFDAGSAYWAGEIQRHINAGLPHSVAETKTGKKREIWKKECFNELRRISLILNAFAKDNRKSHLLRNVEASRNAWRSSKEYQSGIQRVRDWRAGRGMRNGVAIAPVPIGAEEVYEPDDLKVSIMAFDNGVGYEIQHPHVAGTFPNQTTTVNNMLRRDNNDPSGLLNWTKNKKKPGVTWFHIPSNNMTWVEEAIACYYGDKRPTRAQMRNDSAVSQSARHLREYFWRGQQYENAANPSSRFMRPFCQYITPSNNHTGCDNQSIVLFAPFLHWETSRQLSFFTQKIEETLASNANRKRQAAISHKEKRKSERVSLKTDSMASPGRFDSRFVMRRGMLLALDKFRSLSAHSRGSHPLSQYLLDATRLYEELHNYPETSLIEKYLFTDPPLHPRRTLDQGYYTSLQTNRLGDRNQVVYRATTPTNTLHKLFEQAKRHGTCVLCSSSSPQCDKCASIRNVSQALMVDQLWMWVLDQKTIITCFPRRYGLRGRDHSGVFEAIQKRRGQGPVHSVFEIIYAILDECSGTFFDRMRDFSGQPRVLDIFSEAIGNVSKKQIEESHELWKWIDGARRINRKQGMHRSLEIPAWALSPEGHLEQEIDDIVEELEIMISIQKTQSDVYKKFTHHASNIINDIKDGARLFELANGIIRPGSAALMTKVKDRIDYLESLLKTASNAAERVKDLSRLRQQQDSVIQALQSVKLSQDSVDQGRTIMVFTIVTIIFAPLSFLSSIFGMNNAEFGDNQWKIVDQLKLIFSISVGVTALALVFASRRVKLAVIYIAACISNRIAAVLQATGLDSVIHPLSYYIWAVKTMRRTPRGLSARGANS